MRTQAPVWRSLLYVPVNVERFVSKAHTRGADCIQLDLEDSVPPGEKAAARNQVRDAARAAGRGGADVIVRINRPIAMAVRDLEACIDPGIRGIAISKVAGPAHVQLLDELAGALEAERGMTPGHTAFLVMIETPVAFFMMQEIARASPRVVAMNIGGEDFALACGMEPTDQALLHPKQQMIISARAAGVMPLGYIGTVADFGDRERFGQMLRRSRSLGFEGASCIHPDQVPIVNAAYSPSVEEIALAERILEGNARALREGRASFALDGRMIDIPVVERAAQLLARSQAIEARKARQSAAAAQP
jgi:citrate lyase subunit beta/citryl-CoA lyase